MRRPGGPKVDPFELLCEILWTEPYSSHFKNWGGLPADWADYITKDDLYAAMRKAGITSCWMPPEVPA